jgi:protein TonB
VQRFLLALSLALCIHVLFILFKIPEERDRRPILAGEKSISISLSPAVIAQKVKKPTPPKEQKKETKKTNTVKASVPRTVKDSPALSLTADIVKVVHTPVNNSKPAEQPKQKKSSSENKTIDSAPAVTVEASPLYAQNPKPNYPTLAKRRNWQGTVILSVLVTEYGESETVELHKSSGHTMLDNSALTIVRSWRFLPGTIGGRPVAMRVLIPIQFKLQ